MRNTQTAIITHHEAGHTVAALMTLNNGLDDYVSATLVDGVAGFGAARLMISGDHPLQAAFIFYAGPWAEARVQWPKLTLKSLNDDNCGVSFRAAVQAAFDRAPDYGGTSDRAMYTGLAEEVPGLRDREAFWSDQLESVWEVIGVLAAELRARIADPKVVHLGLGIQHVTESAEMPSGEVLALVRPLLESRGRWRYLS